MNMPTCSNPTTTFLFSTTEGEPELRDFPGCRLDERGDRFRAMCVTTGRVVFSVQKALCAYAEQTG